MIELINKYLFGVGVPVMLIFTGIFFCIRLGFFHFLHPLRTLGALRFRKGADGVSSAKALMLALAGTLGVGNMVGVASAISLGGYGAVFWMWVSAILAMVVKYAEIVLAMLHRRFDVNGAPHGAATYYIKDLFGGRTVGRVIAFAFALLCILNAVSMGGMLQVSSAADAASGVMKIPPIAVGLTFAAIAFYALKRGTDGILSLTQTLVPLMSAVFIVISLAVICIRPDESVSAVTMIFKDAFCAKSAAGGVVGFLTSSALRYGTMRGILSNEAGCGTAPMAHATADCNEPARQGVWGIAEVFVDTVLLCTLSAIVIIVGGGCAPDGDYMMMTVSSYVSVLGAWSGYVIAISVLLFALATVVCWGHYGMESVGYITRSKMVGCIFTFVYCVCIALGSVFTGEAIWECSDLAIGGMTIINLPVIIALSGEVKRETERYFSSGG